MKSIKHFAALFLVLLVSTSANDTSKKQNKTSQFTFAAYTFGSFGKLNPESQTALLARLGYKGIILKSETESDFQSLNQYIEEAAKYKGFKVEAIFERYNFTDSTARRERWMKVVDKIAGTQTQLWIIFGKKVEGITDDFIERKLREIVTYSSPKGVQVVLYPHSYCYIASAEDAIPFIERINHPNLTLAVHLCHEIRAGNGARMDQVFDRVKGRIGAVTLAGTDSIADFSAPIRMDASTIKPLDQGNYNLNLFVKPMLKSGYKGSVGFINFKIEDDPETYLAASLKILKAMIH
jgi:sugar phosphate isomerase/epimerase